VSEVLLYDRLVVPELDPAHDWPPEWNAELQRRCLDVLCRSEAGNDGLALAIPWDAEKQERFKSAMSMAAGVDTSQRNPDQGFYVDPYEMTRQLLATDFRPALPGGVSKAWTLANYPSTQAFEHERDEVPEQRRPRLAAIIRQRFLMPAGPDSNGETLRKAVDLSATPSFRAKRAALFAWQENVIEEGIDDDTAVRELEAKLTEYNAAIRRAYRESTVPKFVFTILPIAFGMTSALLGHKLPGEVLAAASGIVSLTRFWRFDRKPVIAAGDADAAALVHDARDKLRLD
jgi:hypothetical protein